MPFDSSDIIDIHVSDRWECTTVTFRVNGVTYVYCSNPSHPGQGGLPGRPLA